MPEFPLSPTPLWRQLTCAAVLPQRSLVTPWLRLGYPFVTFPVSNICAFLILFFSFIPFSLLGLIDTVPRFLKIQPNHWLSRKRNCRNSLSDSVTMNSWPWALSRYWLQKHLQTVSMEKGVPTTLPPVKLQSQPLPFLSWGEPLVELPQSLITCWDLSELLSESWGSNFLTMKEKVEAVYFMGCLWEHSRQNTLKHTWCR